MQPSPTVSDLERRRRRLWFVALLGILLWAAAFAFFLSLLHAFSPWSEFLPFVWILPGVIGWFAWQVPWTLLQVDWKELVAVPAVAAWRPGWELLPGKGLPRKALAESGLSAHPASQYYAEDLVKGSVDGIAVELAEVRATRSVRTSSSRGGRTEVLFQGVLGRAAVRTSGGGDRWYLQPRGLTAALVRLPGQPVDVAHAAEFAREYVLTWTGQRTSPSWSASFCETVLAVARRTGVPFRLAWDGATLWMGTTSLIDLWEPPLWSSLEDGKRLAKALQVLEAWEALVKAFAGPDSPGHP